MGLTRPDDAAVMRLDDETALVFTADFFPPVLDDARDFGRVAAANALSDVYAMGGRPLLALNLAAFPGEPAMLEALGQGLAGAREVCDLAGCLLAGGHTVVDREPKLGLAVVGVVHPDRVITTDGLGPGQVLILTKALGTGVVLTALKRDLAEAHEVAAATESMVTLNRAAAEVMAAQGVRTATDVTGFGLLGHLIEMVRGAAVGVELRAGQLPLLPGARRLAAAGVAPGGAGRNRDNLAEWLEVLPEVPPELALLAVDPQTSGGLLMAVGQAEQTEVLAALAARGAPGTVIGRTLPQLAGRIRLAP